MFATQVLEMLQAITLAALAVAGIIAPWHIITLAMIMGVLIAIELPLRHAYLIELVDGKEDLPNAIALTSLIANMGRLIGPAIAGIVIAAHGEAACFVVNALTFVGVLVELSCHSGEAEPSPAPTTPRAAGLARRLRLRLALGADSSAADRACGRALLATPYMTLMPVLVSEVYGGGAT